MGNPEADRDRVHHVKVILSSCPFIILLDQSTYIYMGPLSSCYPACFWCWGNGPNFQFHFVKLKAMVQKTFFVVEANGVLYKEGVDPAVSFPPATPIFFFNHSSPLLLLRLTDCGLLLGQKVERVPQRGKQRDHLA